MTISRHSIYYPLFAIAACTALSYPATAATFTVNSTADTAGSCTPGSSPCTLRAAVQAANATPGANIITVPAGTYLLSQTPICTTLTTKNPNLNPVAMLPLCITGQMAIVGAGAGLTIIDAQNLDRVLFVGANGNAQVSGVTLQNGSMGPNSYPTGFDGGGGGIHNQGVLSLSDCAIANNTSFIGGGAIFNAGTLTVSGCSITNSATTSNAGQGGAIDSTSGKVTIVNSTLHQNSADGPGGALSNNNATMSVTSSTIDANTAAAGGGGIQNYVGGTLVLTNVTISGNTAGNAGGGVNNSGTLTANNVTIAFNRAQNVAGGLIGDGPMTFGNSMIAGNTAVSRIPDAGCAGNPIASKGYNILFNASDCSFTGDPTGNLIGVDPQLTRLQDNGGGTLTHAISAGSPALDAGSPAAPGSGGSACALADQRGILRPLGARCDIGAFERSAALSISGMSSNHAANVGLVQTFIRGGGFDAGTTVVLRMSGQADITGNSLYSDPGGADLSASFDLTAAAKGRWDVVVTNAELTSRTLASGFTVEAPQAPQLWTGVTGPSAARRARTDTFNLNYGNQGNTDALAVPLTFSVPVGYSLEIYFPVIPPPAQKGQIALDWTTVPIDILTPGAGATNVALLLPIVPAGFSGSLEFSVVPPAGGTDTSFTVFPLIGAPLLNPNLDPNATTQFALGAQAYALANLGVTIPDSHLPILSQYAANQINLAVAAGRAALGSSLGGYPSVYSLGQFSIDVAEFGTASASSAPKLLRPRVSAVPGAECAFTETAGILNFGIPGCLPTPSAVPKPTTITPAKCAALGNSVSPDGKTCVPAPIPPAPPDDPQKGRPHCNYLDKSGCFTIPITGSLDPNDKTGPSGAGTQEYEPGGISYPYTIQFENQATATAAAQTVVVTDQLDATTLDLSTFSLGSISFGNQLMSPPSGSKQFEIALDLRPAQNLIVAIAAGLNQTTGLVTWTFTSLDPVTQQLTTDPIAGFLPPNVTQPQGEAKLLYTINPRANLATGTTICNRAKVVFDVNAPINTPNWCNTVDVTPPVSHVQSLPSTQSVTNFPVQWSGTDLGSGIADYTVYVSDNGGAFTPFQTQTPATQASYTGAPGHSYRFYSIAEDAVSNSEAAKTSAEATTAISSCAADATAQFTVVRSGFRLNTTAHQYQQTVTLTNKTAQTLTGPFAFVVDSLSAGSTLFAPAGTTSCSAPSGSPYVTIPPPSGNNWNAGQSVTVGLNFVDPSNAAITYNARVLAGTPIR